MTPGQAAQLTEGLAEALWQADMVRAMGHRRSVPWSDAGLAAHRQFRSLAAAAMAYRQAVSHGTGITRTTVDGVEQIDLEDYLDPDIAREDRDEQRRMENEFERITEDTV